VVAVIGDGGFQMTIQELGTIFRRKYQLKLSYLIMSFFMVRQWQQLFFDKRYASTEMTNPILSLLQRATISKQKKVIKEKI
jgi:acetolactate synthase-1/2/3 large subunit